MVMARFQSAVTSTSAPVRTVPTTVKPAASVGVAVPNHWPVWRRTKRFAYQSVKDLARDVFRGRGPRDTDPQIFDAEVSIMLWKLFGINLLELQELPYQTVCALTQIAMGYEQARTDAMKEQQDGSRPPPPAFPGGAAPGAVVKTEKLRSWS